MWAGQACCTRSDLRSQELGTGSGASWVSDCTAGAPGSRRAEVWGLYVYCTYPLDDPSTWAGTPDGGFSGPLPLQDGYMRVEAMF